MESTVGWRRRIGLAVGVVALVGSACSSDGGEGPDFDETGATTTTTAVDGADATDTDGAAAEDAVFESATAASVLQADLISLLMEYGYSVRIVLDEGLTGDGPADDPPAASLDATAGALGNRLGVLYGQAQGEALGAAWAAHYGDLADYAFAVGGDDVEAASEAAAALEGFADDLAAALDGLTPGLGSGSVIASADAYVDLMLTALDSAAAGDEAAASDMVAAVDALAGLGRALAVEVDADQELEGSVDAPAADLRAGLTGLVQHDTYLTALTALDADYRDGDPVAAEGARAAVDANTAALAAVFGQIYGSAVASDTERLWGGRTVNILFYGQARDEGDLESILAARDDLTRFRADLGTVVGEVSTGFTPESFAEELNPQVAAMLAAIDAVVTDGDPLGVLQTAGRSGTSTAGVLAGGFEVDL